ncbi:mechanosensitive ion channel family protein [Psychromicrobium xiongbiense]|uniref:mechanosensitive ion channel family protein n=1 Tax=Psychromicrobium xiongbiense TaxID=3051184 RepID=UPI003B20DBBF
MSDITVNTLAGVLSSMSWTADPAVNSWITAAIYLAIGVLIWLIGKFVIRRLVRRVKSGRSILHVKALRWAQPVLRPLDSERRVQRAETMGTLLTSVLGVVVFVITAIYILLSFGFNAGPLLASLGIVGVAVGFGCQQLIRDFLAGIFITFEDQYGIGDVIETSEVVGTVESVGLRITRVRSEDGAIWYLRNGEILRVGNRSQGDYRDPKAAQPTATAATDDAAAQPTATHPTAAQRAGD